MDVEGHPAQPPSHLSMSSITFHQRSCPGNSTNEELITSLGITVHCKGREGYCSPFENLLVIHSTNVY